MRIMRLIISVGIMILMGLMLTISCKPTSRSVRLHEKQEKQMEKLEQQEYRHNVKEHHKMQSPQSKKMMKEAERRSRKMNKHKRL